MGLLRDLPAVGRLLTHEAASALIAASSRAALTAALREVLGEAREAIRRGGAAPDEAMLLARAASRLAASKLAASRLAASDRRVINATGIVLHTNLGRAPLAPEAVRAAVEAAGYLDLEFDLETGERGRRGDAVEALLRELTGCEAAVAVNNGAAAVLLALSAQASAGEVVVSRGELVEIGGGFRIPEIIVQGGARLVEVGTTNRTRLADYQAAIGPATRMLLKVHRSNFRISGFVEEASLEELRGLARTRGLLLMQDLGSGAIADLSALTGGRLREPTVAASVARCDLVAFSADKLLGGPQAGIVAGTAAAVAPLRRHPLMRAVRLDKMALAALAATLRLYRDAPDLAVPVLRMLGQTSEVVRARAEGLATLLADIVGVAACVMASEAEAGGGTLPGETLASAGVTLTVDGLMAEALGRALRLSRPAVVGRIADGHVLLDLFAVADAEVPAIADAVRAIAEGA